MNESALFKNYKESVGKKVDKSELYGGFEGEMID